MASHGDVEHRAHGALESARVEDRAIQHGAADRGSPGVERARSTRRDLAGSSTFILEASNSAIDIQDYIVSLRVDRKIWKRLSVYGSFIYFYQTQKNSLGTSANLNYDATRFNVGVRFEFDPYHL